jgi:hypothetical protein
MIQAFEMLAVLFDAYRASIFGRGDGRRLGVRGRIQRQSYYRYTTQGQRI